MRSILFLVGCVCCSTLYADLSVTVKPVKTRVTANTVETLKLETVDGVQIGREVVRELPPVERPGQTAVAIFLKTSRPIGELLVKLKSRTVDPTEIEPGVYAVSKPGKHEIEINVIGQNPLSWDDETITVEVAGPVPPVPPEPGPGPTPPPGPDDGSFDDLAGRASAIAQQMGQPQRNQIAGVLLAAADKMQSFEFKQVKQASEYIARNWPPCQTPECGALYRLASDDARNRLLSWQETQAYYRVLAAGVLR
jgi:hypothetical protein